MDGNMIEETAKQLGKRKISYQNKHIAEHYDRLTITVRKGVKERIKELTGESVNGYVNRLIAEDLERLEKEMASR